MYNKSTNLAIQNLTDAKFKTSRISLHFITTLNKETAAANALISGIITQSTKSYPTITELSKYLSSLYGANFTCSVSTLGDNQIVSVLVSGISNKYALGGQNLTNEYLDLIKEAIFSPLTDATGNFTQETFEQEKRQLLETMDADFNDKRIYAKIKCQEIMFKDSPASVGKYGNKESLNQVKREDLKAIWKNILDTAKVEVFVLGDCDYDVIEKSISKMFENKPLNITLNQTQTASFTEVKTVCEKMPLAQSKLVMGFNTGEADTDDKTLKIATRLMCVILGGTASSKLFLNVREKLSLCYYCSASLNISKAAMFIESGVETENLEKAKNAILNEIDDMKNGNFTDDDIHFAKLAMINSYKSVSDSLYSTEHWYLSQVLNDEVCTPKQMEDAIADITKEDIIKAAEKVELNTVFMLKGEV